MPPKVAVIYLTYNTPASATDIPECFRSLEKVDYPRDRWRIVIVENPSKHGKSYPMIERDWQPKCGTTLPEMTIIPNARDMGYAGANVVGLQAAKEWGADYVYLLNQDASVDPNFLWRIVQEAEAHPTAAVVQSRIMLKQEPTLLNSRGNALHFLGFGFCDGHRLTPEEAEKRALPMFSASGAGMLVRVAATDVVGLFEPSYYMYHEDIDLSWRARLAGFDIRYAPDSVIYHCYEFSKSIKKFYWMERNRLLTHLVNLRWRTLLLILPAALVMEGGTLAFGVRAGWWKEKVRSWLHLLNPPTWFWIARRRRELARYRRLTDREILSHMVGVIINQEIENPIMTNLVNPVLRIYFWALKRVVRW